MLNSHPIWGQKQSVFGNEDFIYADLTPFEYKFFTIDSYSIMNKENFETFNYKTTIKDLNSQISLSDFKNKNEPSFPRSKSDFSIFFSSSMNLIDQSNSSFYLPISMGSNMTPIMSPNISPNYIIHDSFDLEFLKVKTNRSKNKVINSFPNKEKNYLGTSGISAKQKSYKDKSKLFIVVQKSNFGRKKKDSGKIGKHTKIAKDNLRSKVRTYSLDFLYEYFNKEIQKIEIKNLNKSGEWRLYKIKRIDNKTKVYNLELLDKSLKSIFSAPISRRSDKNENHNKDLINKIYKINQEGNLEKTETIIKFFNMKYKEFFNYVKIIKDKKNLQEKIGGIDDDIKEMIRNFELYLERKLNKNNNNYNQILIEEIKNFPSDISNMKVITKNNNN
jgi:hypothetical protein